MMPELCAWVVKVRDTSLTLCSELPSHAHDTECIVLDPYDRPYPFLANRRACAFPSFHLRASTLRRRAFKLREPSPVVVVVVLVVLVLGSRRTTAGMDLSRRRVLHYHYYLSSDPA